MTCQLAPLSHFSLLAAVLIVAVLWPVCLLVYIFGCFSHVEHFFSELLGFYASYFHQQVIEIIKNEGDLSEEVVGGGGEDGKFGGGVAGAR